MSKFLFGVKSEEQLKTVKKELHCVIRKALSYGVIDFAVIEGRRSKEKQDKYFLEGRSKIKWPNGKHNVTGPDDLASAVDVVPVINGKISWDARHCTVMAGLILAAAHESGVKIRWGGNWDMDGEPITDQTFQDLVHFELA